MSGFRDLRRQVFKDNHLSADNFAEAVTFNPKNGPSRQVIGHVLEERNAEVDNANETEVVRILFTCLRDESDTDKGGILQPVFGDSITRDITVDPNQNRYMYAGETRDVQDYKHQIVFTRYKDSQQGPRR